MKQERERYYRYVYNPTSNPGIVGHSNTANMVVSLSSHFPSTSCSMSETNTLCTLFYVWNKHTVYTVLCLNQTMYTVLCLKQTHCVHCFMSETNTLCITVHPVFHLPNEYTLQKHILYHTVLHVWHKYTLHQSVFNVRNTHSSSICVSCQKHALFINHVSCLKHTLHHIVFHVWKTQSASNCIPCLKQTHR